MCAAVLVNSEKIFVVPETTKHLKGWLMFVDLEESV